MLKYNEQTGYITVEFNWTCDAVVVRQSQVIYKHVLNIEVSENNNQLHNRRIQCLSHFPELANKFYPFLFNAVTSLL